MFERKQPSINTLLVQPYNISGNNPARAVPKSAPSASRRSKKHDFANAFFKSRFFPPYASLCGFSFGFVAGYMLGRMNAFAISHELVGAAFSHFIGGRPSSAGLLVGNILGYMCQQMLYANEIILDPFLYYTRNCSSRK